MRMTALIFLAAVGGSGTGAVDTSGGSGTSHDLLIGTIFTGIVTLILGYLANRGARKRRGEPLPTTSPDPRDKEIVDIQKQRDTLQRKYDESTKRERVLRDHLWKNGINPDTGERFGGVM